VLAGDYITPDSVPYSDSELKIELKRLKLEDDKRPVPLVILKELQRLRCKFLFRLDHAWKEANQMSSDIQFVCKLVDEKLPVIPSIRIKVSRDYPDGNYAEWVRSEDDEKPKEGCLKTQKKFHELLLETMKKKYKDEKSNRTISTILSSWELSVQEACCGMCTA